MENKIKTKKEKDLIKWYNEVVLSADLAEFSMVKGFTIYKPYGYAIWEEIRNYLDKRFKDVGVKNAYFPLLIPESILTKEKEHIKEFNPEVAWVTIGGESKLDERLAIRPTSETIISSTYAKWIKSYRDLPLLLNQWNTVVRWETKETRLFLRGREVLWQEGHCAFETDEEAEKNVLSILMIYKDLMEDMLACPVLIGRKSEGEKFGGAVRTYTIEIPTPDNSMIQSATSHNLGQNFSKLFEVKFLNKENKWNYVYQTSWGVSMRSIGAMIQVHGDNNGLVLPPKIAPIQIVIIPILDGKNDKQILDFSKDIEEKLRKLNIKVQLDARTIYSPGWKFNEYEIKGIPIRVEIGVNEIKNNNVTYKIRLTNEKGSLGVDELNKFNELLDQIQDEMFDKAYERMKNQIVEEKDRNKFIKNLKERKFIIKAAWCGEEKCEEKIKEMTGATSRLIPLEEEKLIDDKCIFCGKPAKYNAYFAQSY